MEKRVLKKWVEVVLAIIFISSLIMLGAETENYFITVKIIAMITFLLSGYLLIKYGRNK